MAHLAITVALVGCGEMPAAEERDATNAVRVQAVGGTGAIVLGGGDFARLPAYPEPTVYEHEYRARLEMVRAGVDLRVPEVREASAAADAVRAVQDGGVDARGQFIRGYMDAGGDVRLLDHFLNVVIPCESRWRTEAVSAGGHLGLAQFAADSWAKAGGGDWTSAYQQGANTARWASMTTPSSQWSCW